MTESRSIRRRILAALGLLSACAIVAFLSAGQQYYSSIAEGESITWSGTLGRQLGYWLAWGLLFPFLVQLSRRLERVRHIGTLLGILSVTGVIASVAHSVLIFALRALFMPSLALRPEPLSLYARGWLLFDLITYAALIAATFAVQHWRRSRAHELRAAQLTAELTRSRLRALQMQLHPHFLFNTLNTVAMLIRTGDGPRALTVIAGLGDLLRQMLDDAGTHEVPLREELAFLQCYLSIEGVRFHDRLRVAVDVTHAALDAHVPRLVLQPLVENAIRHGIAKRAASGRLTITGAQIGSALTMAVRDDGPGPSGTATDGVGLHNTRERLKHLYGDEATLSLAPAPGGGAVATISIPWHTQPLAGTTT
ncbi:MAG TPA: histidine kinase [Gemmatimonadaceae bacterium]|jgi:two-component system LytT family sensor kinase|nr:histidine kinase [Gemmatimonadaceae bacterium]